jgi:hypothetical protein
VRKGEKEERTSVSRRTTVAFLGKSGCLTVAGLTIHIQMPCVHGSAFPSQTPQRKRHRVYECVRACVCVRKREIEKEARSFTHVGGLGTSSLHAHIHAICANNKRAYTHKEIQRNLGASAEVTSTSPCLCVHTRLMCLLLSLSLTHTHTHTLSLSLSLSFAHTHTHTRSLSLSRL